LIDAKVRLKPESESFNFLFIFPPEPWGRKKVIFVRRKTQQKKIRREEEER